VYKGVDMTNEGMETSNRVAVKVSTAQDRLEGTELLQKVLAILFRIAFPARLADSLCTSID
jgi:hypothetical protein